MSGMVWDELQRLQTAVADVAGCLGYELNAHTVERLKEAVSALEAAIVEAWPPDVVMTPVRTDEASPVQEVTLRWPAPERDLLPGVLATTAEQDEAAKVERAGSYRQMWLGRLPLR